MPDDKEVETKNKTSLKIIGKNLAAEAIGIPAVFAVSVIALVGLVIFNIQ